MSRLRRRGDRASSESEFRSFAAAVAPQIRATAARIAGHDQADDVTQETFTQAWKHWDRVQAMDNPAGWMHRVTVNNALDACNATNRRPDPADVHTEHQAAAAPDGWGAPTRPVDCDVVEDMHFSKLVSGLPPNQRAAATLFYMLDYSTEDVADVLGCDPSTARQHLFRARKALKAQLPAPTNTADLADTGAGATVTGGEESAR